MILPQWWGHLWVDINWLGSKPDFNCNLALITEHPWAYLNAHVQCQATQEATEALCAHDAFFWLYFGFLMNYAFGET